MAVVQGIREKVHLPLYDSLSVEAEKQLREAESSSTLKFFVNVQGKTKLETNLQSASLLPHYNTFEARAMRVVISDLPPEFPAELKALGKGFEVLDGQGKFFTINPNNDVVSSGKRDGSITAKVNLGIDRLVELFREARESDDGTAKLAPHDDDVTLFDGAGNKLTPPQVDEVVILNGSARLSLDDIEGLFEGLGKSAP